MTPNKKPLIFFTYNLTLVDSIIAIEANFLKDYKIIVLHISKLTKDRSYIRIKKEYDFEVIDISNYNAWKIYSLLKKKNPASVIFTTYLSHYDYLLYKIAKLNKIPTILHDHGIMFGNTSPQRTEFLKWQILFRFGVFLFNLVLLFIRTIKISIIIDFYYFLKHHFSQMRFDKYLIYCQNNYKYYRHILSITQEKVKITGLPLFIDNTQKKLLCETTKENKFIYIQQPFRKVNFSDATFDEEIELIVRLRDILKRYNYELEVRLHPIENSNEYSILLEKGIKLNNKQNLIEQCAAARAVIGQWSTALFAATPFNTPVLIIAFPKLKEEYIKYYDIFKEFGLFFETVEDLNKYLSKNINNLKCTYNESISYNMIGEVNTFEKNANDLSSLIEN